jgi:ATP-dependent helicase/nuclease subunit B
MPLIWIEFSTLKGMELISQEKYLQAYAEKFPTYIIQPDRSKVALWPECLEGDKKLIGEKSIEAVIQENRQSILQKNWNLYALSSFEKLAWTVVYKISDHIQQDRKNLAIVAQDRLAVRRIRALLDRYPGISIRDFTGWKLSTTAVAAALNSWIELVRQAEGPSLHQIFRFY